MGERGGFVGLHIKGRLTGKLSAVSRRQLTTGGAVPLWAWKAPETSKHHKIQKIESRMSECARASGSLRGAVTSL